MRRKDEAMPQITLEYTPATLAPERIPEMMLQVHQLLAAEVGLAIGSCKSRWRMAGEYLVGNGEPGQGFVHLSVRLLEGRPPDLLEKIGQQCLSILENHVTAAPGVQITVEVGELRRSTYFKA
jgi:5-carboxymethyl-2-hydroxymuconate isomerase